MPGTFICVGDMGVTETYEVSGFVVGKELISK